MRRRTTSTMKRLSQTLGLVATAGGFWLAAGAPIYQSW